MATSKVIDPTDDTISSVRKYERATDRSEFYGFVRNNNVFSFDADGAVISRKLLWPEEPVSTPIKGLQFSLPINVPDLEDLPALPLGLTIITGRTGAGKSKFVKALARQMDLRRVIAIEPHDSAFETRDVQTFSSVDGALADVILAAYRTPGVLQVIDSLRAPLFETSGAAGSKGLSMPFFTQVTKVSNCLALAGITIMATINPMDDDPEYVKGFLSKLSASVPAMFTVDSFSESGEIERFGGTLQMRPNRKPLSFNFTSGAARSVPQEKLLSSISFKTVSSSRSLTSDQRALISAIERAS